jgi:hypothetical protein
MKKSTLFIGFGINLLAAVVSILVCARGFNHLGGAILYLEKRERFPDGVDSWVMADMSSCEKLFALLVGVFVVLFLFDSYFLFRILRPKKTDEHVA